MDWETLKREAVKIFQEYGIPPSVGLAQMALESARGTSNRSRTQNNLFGYAVYSDDAPGKTYKNPLDSIRDYAKLISENPRYKKAMEYVHDPIKMVEEIKKAGYAADPDYVIKLINTPEFREFYNVKPTDKKVAGASVKVNNQYNPSQNYKVGGLESPLPYNKTIGNTKDVNVLDWLGNEAVKVFTSPFNPPPVYGQSQATQQINYSPANQYAVKPGDTLWGIAQRTLGSGNRWQELGYSGDPKKLAVGTKLNIPQPKTQAPVQQPKPSFSPTSSSTSAQVKPAQATMPKLTSYIPPQVQQQPKYSAQPSSSNYKVQFDFRPATSAYGSATLR